MIGLHCTKAWSKTQGLVAKSSGEAELYAVVRASCEALGTQTLLRDLGRECNTRVHVDATLAMAERHEIGTGPVVSAWRRNRPALGDQVV